jgi:glycosyltransferase involved in cell wall biosynthesis
MCGMRIAVVASLVTPLRAAPEGGAQTFLTTLAAQLRGRGHEVTVYCAQGSEVTGVDAVTFAPPPDVEQALMRAIGEPATGVPGLREAFARVFAAVADNGSEAVSQHAFDAEAIELAERLPVLHTLHMPPLPGPVAEAVRGSGARFVAVSEAMGAAWRGAGARDVIVIRNGVVDFAVRPGPVEPIAVVAGRVSPEKGTAVALRVAREAGLEPALVGHVYDHDYHAREVGLPTQPIPQRELWDLMARASVTLVPVAWEEPFGLVAAESQLAGCPVVGYRRGGLSEVVEEGVGGFLVAPDDEAALVAATRSALRLDRVRVRESARQRLLLDGTVDGYERALQTVAREQRQ